MASVASVQFDKQQAGIMKLIALALMLFLTGVQSQDPHAEQEVNNLVEFAKDCEKQENPNADALAKIDQGQKVEDESVERYLVCLLNKARLLDDKGHLKEENIEDTLLGLGLAPEAVALVEDQCDTEGKDKGETALNFSVCLIRAFQSMEKFVEEELKE